MQAQATEHPTPPLPPPKPCPSAPSRPPPLWSWALKKSTTAAFAAALALFLAISVIAGWSLERLADSHPRVADTEQVLHTLSTLQLAVTKSQSHSRGFLATGNESFLSFMATDAARCDSALAELRSLTSDNPQQQTRLTSLAPEVVTVLHWFQTMIAARRSGQAAATTEEMVEHGERLMNALHAAFAEFGQAERSLLQARERKMESLSRVSFRVTAFGTFASLAIFLSVLVGLNRAEARRTLAEVELRLLNTSLEQRVPARTAALAAANQELEAFSCSVSHDLRLPLRAMDGFSMALLEDCGAQLDATAQGYLHRIRAGSQRMAGLIDDLLNLSQLSRGALRHERVDLSALAREIGADLAQAAPGRAVEPRVAPGLVAECDGRMMRVVLTNLLGNAWKFTGRQAEACIEVGVGSADGEPVFFVRDNEAGFDPAYAGKLFGAFQRLHSTEEFAGNGIGLALVQRIVRRHGGRVWAESAGRPGRHLSFHAG